MGLMCLLQKPPSSVLYVLCRLNEKYNQYISLLIHCKQTESEYIDV